MELLDNFLDWIAPVVDAVVHATSFFPIDLILLALVAAAFARFIWVMTRYTRVWDNFSRSLVATFASTGLIYVFVVANALIGDIPGEMVILWIIRIFLLSSIIWCQYELSRELKKVPGILFIRDRNWVRRRIGNIETIRAILRTDPSTPPELLLAIEGELDEMYRFKQVVWEEDRKHGVDQEPQWMRNKYYVEKHEESKSSSLAPAGVPDHDKGGSQ